MSGSDLHFSPLLAASGVEFLVVLLIMAASAIYNWLQKRKEGEQSDWGEAEKPSRPAAPRKTTDWEEELRRMLEGETPAAQPPPPPVIREQRQSPPPVPRTAQTHVPPPVAPPVQTARTYRGHCEHCAGHIEFPSNLMGEDVPCPHCQRLTRLYPYSETTVERRAHRPELSPVLPSTPVETQSYIQQALTSHFGNAPKGSSKGAHTRRREVSPEVQEVVALFRHPRTARQAVIASIILNPPKALES